MKFAWIDLRTVAPPQVEAVVDAAVHARLDGVVAADPALLATLPPTIRKVLLPAGDVGATDQPADLVAIVVTDTDQVDALAEAVRTGRGSGAAVVRVRDDRTLKLACAAAVALPYTVVSFTDPTKIPLEIVIAAADRAPGKLVTEVADLDEARIVLDVLEHGSDGVLLAPADATEVFALARLLQESTPALELATLTVDSVAHNGLGDRVCVDTCSHFEEDEGILVGSYSSGFVLCCSETHPLPYMPTRPFRVNAGALHSYVLGPDNRTNYLSELRSGSTVLAVRADGSTRRVVVGRAKLESRPLLTITAHSAEGVAVSLTVQDDWHVRVLGPGGKVRNVTELQRGDELLGYLATDKRHVGIPIGEFCRES
ncbi:3-dehydroquinate synthase II family protein [Goodfellowiella coeruleoviolacea]|uniref:3-amino-4-hydroxybenzoic acid synthase n=1 Tax=Goodfellowiella coeruleoviolacea TaxID=334858 RepID=A0AAE3G8S1_9PSEU|nr:3-amino-4-hydroxybenzoic acid synthase [Goodfellowiella coeruleoviolacea]